MKGRRREGRETHTRRIYSYAVTLCDSIPEKLWEAAREMQRLWNVAVTEHDAVCAEAKNQPKEEKTALFRSLYSRIYPQFAESWLPSTFYKFVYLRQFVPAQEAFARGLRGAPKPHHRLTKIILPHVDAAGGKGLEYATLLRDSKPYYLRAPLTLDGKQLSRGFITINDERIWFDAVIHRPIPADALIKQFALVGVLERPFGWRWTLQVTTEAPPLDLPAPVEAKWVAIDQGWRQRENGVRVALLLDHEGRTRELLLPFRCDNNALRRREKLVARRGLEPDILDWRDLWERQSRADLYLEQVKAQLRACDKTDWPEEAKQVMAGIVKMRGGGLNRLARILGDAAPAFFVEWLAASRLEFKRMRAAELRMIAHREWLYRNWASQIAQAYDCLKYEGDLSFKAMAEAQDQDYAIQASQKYRADMVSPHTFRMYLLEAFKKHGKVLDPRESARSTGLCAICGANVECGPSLVLTCANGHQQDQDFNAVKNLSSPDWPKVRAQGRRGGRMKEVTAWS